jgi:hypothetical protein
MTNEEAYALGRRLVACKGFRPMRGMRDMQGGTWKQSELFRWWHDHHTPDVRDPATLGCLLALVREAWGDSQIYVAGRGLWDVFTSHDVEIVQDRYTEAEALVAALEAAPCST